MVKNSVCIITSDNDIEEVVERFGTKDFYYKPLFKLEDNNRDEYYEEDLKLKLLGENNIFSTEIPRLKGFRAKTTDREKRENVLSIVEGIFMNERQINIVNDFAKYGNMVLIVPNKVKDPSATRSNMEIRISDDIMEDFIEKFRRKMYLQEGLRIYTIDTYDSGLEINPEEDIQKFIERQKELVKEERKNTIENIMKHFTINFKYRVMSYYTKLQEYSMNEIMSELDKLGYLDDRFDDCFINEEEARRILAKRLCTLSFRNDIDILMNEGIIPKNAIQYDLNV